MESECVEKICPLHKGYWAVQRLTLANVIMNYQAGLLRCLLLRRLSMYGYHHVIAVHGNDSLAVAVCAASFEPHKFGKSNCSSAMNRSEIQNNKKFNFLWFVMHKSRMGTLSQFVVCVICEYRGHLVFVYRCHNDCGVWTSKIFFHCLHTSPTWHSEMSSRYENITSNTSTGSAAIVFVGLAADVDAWSLTTWSLTTGRMAFSWFSVRAHKYWRRLRGGCGSGRSPKNAFS